eukprot:gb/GECG01016569.1/.p1 GENE.gb/GECG01016569.1/~~gb/GECG01016569.1/.p1  ORF type:complete len:1057 (+),score=141.89 gb/GECG01016569.1/:1-3171(+)
MGNTPSKRTGNSSVHSATTSEQDNASRKDRGSSSAACCRAPVIPHDPPTPLEPAKEEDEDTGTEDESGGDQAPALPELEYCTMQSEVHGAADLANAEPDDTVYSVSVTLVQARKLKKMDIFTKSDPYLRINCGSLCLRSTIRYNTLTPVYNERFDFVMKEKPDSIHLSMHDRDLARKDEFMGEVSIPLTDNDFEDKIHPFNWIPLSKGTKKLGEIQVQIACWEAVKRDKHMQEKVRYIENIGLLTLRLRSLERVRLNASDRQQLGIKEDTPLYPVCIIVKGTIAFQSCRGFTVDPNDPEPVELNQTCRTWISQGEEEYILSFSLYHDTISANRKRKRRSRWLSHGRRRRRSETDGAALTPRGEKEDVDEVHPNIGHEEGKGLKLIGRAFLPLSKLLKEPASSITLQFRPVDQKRLTDAGATDMLRSMTLGDSDDDNVNDIRDFSHSKKDIEKDEALKLSRELEFAEGTDSNDKKQEDAPIPTNESNTEVNESKSGTRVEDTPVVAGRKSENEGISSTANVGEACTQQDGVSVQITPSQKKRSRFHLLRNSMSVQRRRASAATPAQTAPVVATLTLDYSFSNKDEVERWYFGSLMNEFDFNEDGKLSKAEFTAVLSALSHWSGKTWSDEQVELLFSYLDIDSNGELEEDELLAYLRSADFQSKPLGYQLLTYLADGVTSSSGALMDLYSTVHSAGESSAGADVVAIRDGGNVTRDKDGLLVYDATSGLIVREHIPGYVKTAIDLLYKAVIGSKFVPFTVVRGLLWAMTIKEGKKMSSTKSARKIPGFIDSFNINVEEIEKPVSEYKTFNEFFYRKLKKGARKIADPEKENVIVAPADCRLTVFETLYEATSIWIKGNRFTVENLFGAEPELQKHAHRFVGGAIMISRLAPQDYHRWHFPVSGTLGKHHRVNGGFYTVNPIAIRRRLNVFTENERIIVLMDSDACGLVAMVCVGATMVGSINITVDDGAYVKKGDEHGYFAFGGSTILTLFEPEARVRFRRKFREHSGIGLETLVKMGMRVGHSVEAEDDDDIETESSIREAREVTENSGEDGSSDAP